MRTADDLRVELINAGLSVEEAQSIKGKAALIKKLECMGVAQEDELEVDFDSATLEGNEVKVADEDKTPIYNSLEWSDYVMSQFQPSELDNGHPKVSGLRRVAELLLGPIVDSGPVETHPSQALDHPGRASSVFSITFDWRYSGEPRVFRASGDSYVGNTDDKYAVFPLAIAETRAEVRALRRALKINVAAADELTSKTFSPVKEIESKEIVWEPNEPVGSPQVTAINTLCSRIDIDVDKFINSGEKQYKNISEITKDTALKMIETLNVYQNDKTRIPEFLRKV